jgi:LytS/YehU family sensor histidine kinase
VPVLLLQPVIENAVKHGISGLYKDGILKIDYAVKENNIIVNVTDNGTGYSNIQKGHGLKLTDDRIALLNKVLKGQSVHWQINNTGSGTQALFIFKNWLS